MQVGNNFIDLVKKTVLSLLYLVFAAYVLTYTVADVDLWGYLTFGRLFWETGKFPYKDIFAYLPTHDTWVFHEWLTGVLFFPLYQKFGAAALQLLKYSIGLATMGFIFLTAVRRGANYYSAVLILIAIGGILDFGYSPVRAQIFTFFFFAVTLYLLETTRTTRRWQILWWIIPTQILWCNLHGGFLVGLGLLALYAAGEAIARKPFVPYVMVLVFSSLATLINPYGIEYWRFFARSLPMPRPELIEWFSVYAGYKYGVLNNFAIIYILFIIIFLVLLLLWRKPRELTVYLVLGLTLFLGLKQQRHICFFLLLAGAYMPVWLSDFLNAMKSDVLIRGIQDRIGWKTPTACAVVLALILTVKIINQNPMSLTLPSQPNKDKKFSVFYPSGAVNYIKEQELSGNILTEFHWGEYLIWELHPLCRVSLDGRYEQVYPERITREYFDFIFCRRGWKDFLTRYPPNLILIKNGSKLSGALNKEFGWKQIYSDSGAALFSRSFD
jgi:hypothetical protein